MRISANERRALLVLSLIALLVTVAYLVWHRYAYDPCSTPESRRVNACPVPATG